MSTTVGAVTASLVPCVMLTRDGGVCGRDGQVGLPVGICSEHAVTVYRAVARLIDVQREREAS